MSTTSRQLYPDPGTESVQRHVLYAYWLTIGDEMPAKTEYDAVTNKPQVLAALNTIDQLLLQRCPVPRSRMETIVHNGVKMLEIKAPPRGRTITRLLAHRDRDWTIHIALVREKKSQSLPNSWKKLAADRIKRATQAGGRQ